MLILKANHAIFEDVGLDWSLVGIGPEADVEIHPGINEAFANQLIGDGNVSCWCTARNAEGRYPGMANSPGFVFLLDHEALVAAGANDAECWYARGAEEGEYRDPDHDGDPVCADCASHGSYRKPLRKLPKGQRGPCWCCCEMIAETDQENRQNQEEMDRELDWQEVNCRD